MKQIILMRADLKMRRGKEIAQGAHASMKALLENMDDDRVKSWLGMAFAKVCLTVDSEEELLNILKKAEELGMITCKIIDAGRTEFNGVPTLTCGAIGPDVNEAFIGLTDHLRLR